MSCASTADPPAAAGIAGMLAAPSLLSRKAAHRTCWSSGWATPSSAMTESAGAWPRQCAKPCPAIEVECLALGGLSLMERLVGYQRAIIIDAIQTRTGRSGDVYTLPLDALPNYSAGHTTAIHDTSLQNALDLGRRMGAVLPARIDVVAIEAERVFDFSETLSPAVAAAIPIATAAVAALVDALRGEPHDLA